MKKAKKIIALVLVLALSISLLSTVAFAKDIGGDDPEAPKKHTVLFFGDQSIDFDNFENSYAPKFVDYLKKGPAKDSVVTGKTANILDDATNAALVNAGFTELGDFSSMRNSDLYALIRPPKDDAILKLFDIDNPSPTQDAYFKNILGTELKYDTTDEAARQALLKALLGVEYKPVLNGFDEPVAPVADPDVKTIILDLTRNDLTGYLMERLMDIVENGGETYAQDTLARLPYDMSYEVDAILAAAMEGLKLALNKVLYEDAELAEQISAAAEYTMLNFCLGFTEAVAAIKYWYPTAKLIAVGASNELKGVKITIPDKHNPESNIMIDVGAIYQSIASFANAYITDFCSKYNVNNTYYYADVSKGVDTIYMSTDEKDVAKFKEHVATDAAARVKAMLTDVQLEGLLAKLNDVFAKTAAEFTVDVVKFTHLGGNVVKAANEKSFNLVEILKIVNAPEKEGEGIDPKTIKTADVKTAEVMGLVEEALKDGMLKDFSDLTPTDKAILGLYGIIADKSFSSLPGAEGQKAKLDAVVEGYNKLLPANQDGEDAVGGFFLDGLFSVLNVFKSDILNALNNFFNNLFDDGLFTKIGDFFRGILGRT